MRGAGGLKLSESILHVLQGRGRVRRELIRALELMQGTHRLRDRCGKVDQLARHARISLKSIEAARERLAGRT